MNVEVTAVGDGPRDAMALIRAKHVVTRMRNAVAILSAENGLYVKVVSSTSVGSQVGRTVHSVLSISPTKPVKPRAKSRSRS